MFTAMAKEVSFFTISIFIITAFGHYSIFIARSFVVFSLSRILTHTHSNILFIQKFLELISLTCNYLILPAFISS